MADDLMPLMLSIEANLTKYNKQMAAAAATAATTAGQIDKSFETANDNIANSYTKAGKAAEASMGMQKQAVTNLTFELRHLADSLASGQSPFTIMVEQGSHVAEAFMEAGNTGTSAFGTLVGVFQKIMNPVTLATIAIVGLGAAAFKFYSDWSTGGAQTGKELDDTINKVAKLSENLKELAPEFYAAAQAAKVTADAANNLALATQNVKNTTAALATMFADVRGQVELARGNLAGQFGDTKEGKDLDYITSSVLKLIDGFNAGTVSATDFKSGIRNVTDELNNYSKLSPDVVAVMNALKGLGDQAVAAKEKIAGATEAQKEFQAGLDPEKAKAFEAAMKKLGDTATGSMDAATKAVNDYNEAIKNAQNAMQGLEAEQAKAAALAKINADAVGNLVTTVLGDTSDTKRIIGQLESGNNPATRNKTSTASGQYQFTDDTAVTVAKEISEFKDLTREQILAQKDNADFQSKLMDKLLADDATKLEAIGKPINTLNLYIEHLLGAGGAQKFLTADPNAKAASVVGDAAASQNAALLGNGKTVAEATAAITASLHAADVASSQALKDYKATIQATEDQTTALQAEAKARGDNNTLIDQQTYVMEKAKKETELEQAARKQGLELNDQLKAQIEQVADAYAKAKAGAKGYNDEQKASAEQAKITVEAQKKMAAQLAQMRDQMASLSASFVSGFISDLENGDKAVTALKDSLKKLADQLLSMALNSLFRELFAGLFSGATTGAGGGKGGFFANIFSGIFHGGGTVGSGGAGRSLPAGVFMGAPRFHDGVAGLGSDELPAILQRGETVLPKGYAAGGGNSSVSNSIGAINIDMSGTGKVAADSQKGAQFGEIVRKLIQTEIVAQSRPGGLLTGSGSGARVGR